MEQGILKKENMNTLLDDVLKEYKVFAPVNVSSGVSLSEITSGIEVDFNNFNLKISPKGLFFPQSEGVFSFLDAGSEEPSPLLSSLGEKTVLFGSRPCDARALLHLDSVFSEGIFQDPCYNSRRHSTLIMSIACTNPSETCFCTSFGDSPSGRKGSDIMIFEMNDFFFFEAGSKKGHQFMEDFSSRFSTAAKEDVVAVEKAAASIEKKVKLLDNVNISEMKENIFKSIPWDSLTRRCLSCAVCTYFCPTCHCFAFFDEGTSSAGKRSRDWDSCMFPEFSREASGHNPRMLKEQRMRQRIMHKFVYTVENFGEAFCVGCGRCIINCPVNMDIREILDEITK